MNKGDQLPEEHHVSRACGRGYVNNKVTSAAFSPRPQDENCLSVDWVECEFVEPDLRNVEGVVKRCRLPVRPQKLSILNNSQIRELYIQDISLDVIYYPFGTGRNSNLCHSRITGMCGNIVDQDLQQELADLANRSPIVDLPKK